MYTKEPSCYHLQSHLLLSAGTKSGTAVTGTQYTPHPVCFYCFSSRHYSFVSNNHFKGVLHALADLAAASLHVMHTLKP